jgi:lysozyme
MQTHPRLSKSGLELVKRFEGLRQSAASLPAGGWTIGYGHTVSARQGARVSAEDAEALLLYDLRKVAQAVDEAVFTPLNQNQFDAIVAFAFNVGVDSFLRSNVLKRLNEGSYLQAAAAIELWRKADIHGDSIVVDALVRRRASEKALFLTPTEGFRPVPTPVVRAEFDPAPELAAQQPGLADAADVRVALQGEVARPELYVEPPPVIAEPEPEAEPAPEPEAAPEAPAETEQSAVQIAARNVAEKLSRLFPEEAPPPAVAPPTEQPEAEPEPEAAGFPQAEPTAETAPFELTAAPEAEPEAAPAAPEPVAEAAPEPVAAPSLFAVPPPRLYPTREASFPAQAENDDEEEVPSGPFGRRYPTLAERAAAQPVDMVRPPPPLSLGVLVLGVFGAALFCGALATMVFGRATLVNLALGLLGVVCMVPSGLKLLTQLFAVRDAGDIDEA